VLLIVTKNWLSSKWCFAEFTQARALGKSIFVVIETPKGETMVASDLQVCDLTKDPEGGRERLRHARPTERRIYAQLLAALDVGVEQRSATLADLETRMVRLLKQVGVRVLVFDEVHNLLAGSPREQRVILQLFRFLSNELKASLVCLGVADAREAIAGDTQLARRLDQLALPRWNADEEFQALVTAVLRSLPLRRASSLSAQSLRHLARVSNGITAKVFAMLNELAIEAVTTGVERITDEAMEAWKPAAEKEAAFA
jgi:hypothetical protein